MEGRTLIEVATLIAVVRLEHDAYGIAIRDDIENFRGQPVPLASVYAALARLTRLGWLTVSSSPAYAIQGGRAKRVYRLTHAGRVMLQEERRQWMWLWGTLPRDFERGL